MLDIKHTGYPESPKNNGDAYKQPDILQYDPYDQYQQSRTSGKPAATAGYPVQPKLEFKIFAKNIRRKEGIKDNNDINHRGHPENMPPMPDIRSNPN